MGPTETCSMTNTKLARIAWRSARDPGKRFDHLMHHFTEESLAACFHALDGNKAVGLEGVSKAHYGEHLRENLEDLVGRLKRMAYRPMPVRQVLIPKDGPLGATRPLGISVLEDKIVQQEMQRVLESIYEPLFLDCSYGFRPGRGCHDAIKALHQHLWRNEVETVIDLALANFFGTISYELLEEMLQEKIGDQRVLRYLRRMLKAGVLTDGDVVVNDSGVPQGSICSPVLANVFAHHVIDTWFATTVKAHCCGRVELFRYADDAVICCRYTQDAIRIKEVLRQRLARYQLQLNEGKTRLVPFSKRAQRQGDQQEGFDFLGFTFYLGKSRKHTVMPKVKTSGKRIRTKLRRLQDWARRMANRLPLTQLWRMFCAKMQGHIRYYAVTFNTHAVNAFLGRATRLLFRRLNRRSQRKSFTWEKFRRFIALHPLPRVSVCHAVYSPPRRCHVNDFVLSLLP